MKVDVLEVLKDCAIALANEDACGHAAELTDARAAIAELIEADQAYDEAWENMRFDQGANAGELFNAAKARRTAAIAKVSP